MKNAISIILSLAMLLPVLAFGQEPVPTNRYGMKLDRNPDGTYSLQKEKRYAKILNLAEVPGLLEPYTYVKDKLDSKLYKQTQTEDVVYKTHDGYELKMAIDKAVTEKPSPVMIFIHGGGWARGSNDSARSLSKYLAQQNGITGVRIQYTLAPQPGADVQVSIADVMDAVKFLKAHAAEYNIDPSRIGFLGSSAGAHLAAVAAMKCPDTKVLVGYSGIYDLTTAAITTRTKDPERIAYFGGLDEKYLAEASPVALIPKKKPIAAQLYCGTGDITVEYTQSEEFAAALKRHKANVELLVYQYYDHGLNSKGSDKMEEIFFKTAAFIAENL